MRQVGRTGIDLVQLRAKAALDRDLLKDAKIIHQLCQERGIIFIINNRLDIAQVVDADGLHLGQADLPLRAARVFLGRNKIIGISCHNLTQALKAEAEGADYISIGPAFSTLTKPSLKPINLRLIKMINRKLKIPFFAIGGISQANINKVKSYGAKRVAVCRAICRAKNIKKSVCNLRNLIYDYSDQA